MAVRRLNSAQDREYDAARGHAATGWMRCVACGTIYIATAHQRVEKSTEHVGFTVTLAFQQYVNTIVMLSEYSVRSHGHSACDANS